MFEEMSNYDRGRHVWKSDTGDLGHAAVATKVHGGGGMRAHHGLTSIETPQISLSNI